MHELIIEDPKKVIAALDVVITELKGLMKAVETTADIGKMNLAIAGLDKTFISFESLVPTIKGAIDTVTEIMEHIDRFTRQFADMNSDITI